MLTRPSLGVLSLLAGFCTLASIHAADTPRPTSQFVRDRWEAEHGFPGGAVWAIAQSGDGYLWIGAEKGLVRFDGVAFTLVQQTSPGYPPISRVLGLTPDANGDAWARLQGSRLLRCRGDQIEDVRSKAIAGETEFTAMSRSASGTVLLAGLRSGIVRQRASDFDSLSATVTLPRSVVISIAERPAGVVWIGTRDRGLFQLRDGHLSESVPGLPDPKINAILPIGDTELWVGTDNGIALVDRSAVVGAGLPKPLHGIQALTMIADRAENVWIGTTRGLVRLDRHRSITLDERDRGATSVTALFEDREGNIWSGDSRGIERFRRSAFLTHLDAQVPSASYGPVYVDAEHRAWFGPPEGGLYRLVESTVERIAAAGLTGDVVYSIDGDARELWIGRQRGGLTHLRETDGELVPKTYTEADGLAQNSVYAVLRARDGSVWAGTLNGGVSRFKNGRFVTYTTRDGLASNSVVSLAEGADGTVWLATPGGLSAFREKWERYGVEQGLPSTDVTALLADANGAIWIGTAAGLAWRDARGFHAVADLAEPILGLAEDRRGSLWIATARRILRAGRDALQTGGARAADLREYGVADGLRSVEVMKRHRAVAADSLGRVWFSMTRGLSMTDPAQVAAGAPPALVRVKGMSVDGAPIDLRETVRIPATSQRITFDYAGLSLSIPERVRFRYRLDGFDHDWSEPTAAREAVYTNLRHGQYTFRLMASNSQGVWNGTEATVGLVINPMFWQTWWFQLSAAALGLLVVLAAYRIRLHQMTNQLSVRFEERLAERTRIAQELHDTLLQGFVSASMQLHVAADRLPADSPAKASLGRVLDLMRQVIDEARNAVRGLRSPDAGSRDLAEAFTGIQQELALGDHVDYRVFVEGQPRPLNPAVRDEVYRIGREALMNAFRHSEAKAIELELEYAAKHVRMLVRDDGLGMEPDVVKSGTDGHWGLSGMRERAERIGARFKVFSRAHAGTEIELLIPAHIAFRKEKDR